MAQVKTESEMFPLVESWLKSSMTQKEFSRKHELPLHILAYQVARYRKAGPPVAPSKQQSPPQKESPAFIRLSPPAAVAPASAAVSASAVTVGANADTVVELPSGVMVRFSGLVPVAYLRELVGLSTAGC